MNQCEVAPLQVSAVGVTASGRSEVVGWKQDIQKRHCVRAEHR